MKDSVRSIIIVNDGSEASRNLFEVLSEEYLPFIGPELSEETFISLAELKQFDAALIMAGDVFPKLSDDFVQNVASFVQDGGVLIAMPFLAWSVVHKGNMSLENLLPVTIDRFYEKELIEWQENRYSKSMEKGVTFHRLYASGEVLKKKETAIEILHETKHDSVLLAEMIVGKGIVRYLNLTHHCHGKGAIPIWKNPETHDLIKLTLVKEKYKTYDEQKRAPMKLIKRNELLHANLDYDHNVRNSLDHQKLFELKVQKEMVHEIMHARELGWNGTHDSIQDHHRSETLVYAKTLRAIQSLPLAEKIPELTYLLCSDTDFKSYNRLERIEACRSILRLIMNGQTSNRVIEAFSSLKAKNAYNHWKGAVLEKLGGFFFMLEPGLEIIGRNIRTNMCEIDVLIRNESNTTFWKQLGSPIAVECKNTAEKIGTQKITHFETKLRKMKIKTGFLISSYGPTGDSLADATYLIKNAKMNDDINIINLTFDDLKEALKHYSISDYIKKVYYSLYQ